MQHLMNKIVKESSFVDILALVSSNDVSALWTLMENFFEEPNVAGCSLFNSSSNWD